MSNNARQKKSSGRPGNALEVKSLRKAMCVLEAFCGHRQSLSLDDITKAVGLDKSAVQRAAYTLKELNYLEQDPCTRRYRLGLRVLNISFNFFRSHPLVQRASPILVDLRQAISERVDLTLPCGDSVVYVIRMQAKRENLPHAAVGQRLPMYCSAGGRAILAALDKEEAEEIINASELQPFTPYTVTDPKTLMAEVLKAKHQGYACQQEQWRLGEIVVAAAVKDDSGRPVAAVHIAGTTAEWDAGEFERRYAAFAMAAARDINE